MNLQTTENAAIADLLDQVSSLPPPPKLLPQLLGILADPNADVSRVVDVVVLDPALTIRVLQLCNSAYFGFSQRVETVAEAVARLGFHGIFQIVAVVSGEKFLQTAHTRAIDADRLWRHLVYSAFAAQAIGRRTGADENFLFTAGLLHDFGKIPLAEVLQGDYAALVTDSGLSGRVLCDLETASFGMNHAEVGAELLRRWDFSPAFVTNIQFHHAPGGAGECEGLAACLALADVIAHSFDDPEDPAWISHPDLRSAAALLSLSTGNVERVRETVVTKAKSIEAMCGARG
jgi:putative nucleotidyltransferase with HDIG domain